MGVKSLMTLVPGRAKERFCFWGQWHL